MCQFLSADDEVVTASFFIVQTIFCDSLKKENHPGLERCESE